MLMTKEKYWIKRLTLAYIAVAAAGIAQLAFAAVKIFLPLLRWMNVDFVNYGSDTVSGWETIFSLFEVLSGTLFAPILFAAITLLTVIIAAYWIAGIISSLSLKKASQSGLPYNGLGIFFGIWSIIPIIIRIGGSLKYVPETETIFTNAMFVMSWFIPVASAIIGISVLSIIIWKNAGTIKRKGEKL